MASEERWRWGGGSGGRRARGRWAAAVAAGRVRSGGRGESGHVPVPVRGSKEGGEGWGVGRRCRRGVGKGQGGKSRVGVLHVTVALLASPILIPPASPPHSPASPSLLASTHGHRHMPRLPSAPALHPPRC